MNETIEYYNHNADSFFSGTINADMSDCRNRFLSYVNFKGKILDAGCGSGRDALAFQQVGYQVDAFDASTELCKKASELLGFPVACKRFEELTGNEEYDGIWACASLLHVKGEDLPDVMTRLQKMLKPNGILYASFKEGNFEREKGGRFFHDMTEQSCIDLFKQAGLQVLETFKSEDVRNDHTEIWVNIIGKKK